MSREMKDSGVEWIGEIPEDWDTFPIKRNYRIVAGATPKSDKPENWDGEIPWITPSDYKTGDKYILSGKKSITEKGYNSCSTTMVPANSIIFSKRAPVGTVAISANELCTNQGCLSCVPLNKSNSVFGYYSMIAGKNAFEMAALGTTFMEISADAFANMKLPYCDTTEQQQIVHFLDCKCTAIDTAIEKTKKSIEKLEEYKKAVITKAVTKGIDPNAKMKNSGVEWIGEMPETWEIRRIKTVGTYRNGLTYSPDDLTDETKGTLVLRSSNIKDGKLVLQDNLYVRTHISDKLRVKKGDILICSRNGSRALIGKNALIDSDMDASFGAFMMIYRSKDPYYIHWVLKSEMMSYYLASFTTSTINQLIGSEFGNMYLPWPSNIQERQQISNYLNSKCSSINALVTRKQETINKLEEYKKSLIYYAVTGKIDCRNEVIE